jgi:hypothetical protein
MKTLGYMGYVFSLGFLFLLYGKSRNGWWFEKSVTFWHPSFITKIRGFYEDIRSGAWDICGGAFSLLDFFFLLWDGRIREKKVMNGFKRSNRGWGATFFYPWWVLIMAEGPSRNPRFDNVWAPPPGWITLNATVIVPFFILWITKFTPFSSEIRVNTLGALVSVSSLGYTRIWMVLWRHKGWGLGYRGLGMCVFSLDFFFLLWVSNVWEKRVATKYNEIDEEWNKRSDEVEFEVIFWRRSRKKIKGFMKIVGYMWDAFSLDFFFLLWDSNVWEKKIPKIYNEVTEFGRVLWRYKERSLGYKGIVFSLWIPFFFFMGNREIGDVLRNRSWIGHESVMNRSWIGHEWGYRDLQRR